MVWVVQCNPSLFQFKTVDPCPVTTVFPKRSLFVLEAPFIYWEAAVNVPWSLLFSWLKSPNSPCLCSLERPCLSWAVNARPGHSTPERVSLEHSRRRESPALTCWPSCFWCNTRIGWLWYANISCCLMSNFSTTTVPKSNYSGCSLLIQFQFVVTLETDWRESGTRPCTWPYWTSWSSQGPTSQDSQDQLSPGKRRNKMSFERYVEAIWTL